MKTLGENLAHRILKYTLSASPEYNVGVNVET